MQFNINSLVTVVIPNYNHKELLNNKGYYYEELGGDIYHYVITSGEKTTGGYSIDIKSVTKNENNIKVVVHETIPTGVATTAFTYPYIILELYEKPTNIEIVDDYGKVYKKIN